MSVLLSIKNSDSQLSKLPVEQTSEIKPLLLKAFQGGGDFPVSAAVLRNIRVLLGASSPNAAQVVKAIVADPLMAMRIVSLANFPAYSRGRPVQSVTNAVNQLGFVTVVKMIEDFGAQKDLKSIFLGRGSSAILLSRIVLASSISQKLVELLIPRKGLFELALIACVVSNLPEFLLSYYKPNYFAALTIDVRKNTTDYEKSFKKIFKQASSDLAEELVTSLSLPKEYGSLARALGGPPWNRRWGPDDKDETRAIVKSVYLANVISSKLFTFCIAEEARAFLREVGAKSVDLATDDLFDTLEEIGETIRDNLDQIGIPQFRLPMLDIRNKPKGEAVEVKPPETANVKDFSSRLNPFLVELKVIFKSKTVEGEPGRVFHAVHCTLSALLHALYFDRACLIAIDDSGMFKIQLLYGPTTPEAEVYARKLDAKDREFLPDLSAFHNRKAVFSGDPIFTDDWPFVAFPIIIGGIPVGVFYADRLASSKAPGLSLEEQLVLTALAEQWQEVPGDFR